MDLNQMAYRIVQHATQPQEPETPAQISGREGGLKGGKARAAKLSPEERSEIARKAAQARWGQERPADIPGMTRDGSEKRSRTE